MSADSYTSNPIIKTNNILNIIVMKPIYLAENTRVNWVDRGVLWSFHKEIIVAQRWDLSAISRQIIWIYLN